MQKARIQKAEEFRQYYLLVLPQFVHKVSSVLPFAFGEPQQSSSFC